LALKILTKNHKPFRTRQNPHLRRVNYLAHLVLGGLEPERALGNFIGDAVKGRRWQDYPPGVQQGILLHRRIDALADAHPEARATRAEIRPALGRWSGVAMDLLHDHLLARDFEALSGQTLSLPAFAEQAHAVLLAQRHLMPERSQRFLDAMVAHGWLSGYARLEVMQEVSRQMDRRMALRTGAASNLEGLWAGWAHAPAARRWEERFRVCWSDVRRELAADPGLDRAEPFRRSGE
jgi:acyl carrier protein phosphodiesterase